MTTDRYILRSNSLTESNETFQTNHWSPWPNAVLSSLYFVLMTLVFVGNSLVILAVVTTKRLHRKPHCFIVSLAMSDLLTIIGPIPMSGAFIYYGYWPFRQRGWCVYYIGSSHFLCAASMYNLAVISLDRMIACTEPFRYKTKFITPHVILLITASWLVPFLLVLITFTSGTLPVVEHGKCYSRLAIRFRIPVFLIAFMIPLSVMACANMRILRTLCTRNHGQTSSRFRGIGSGSRQTTNHATATKLRFRVSTERDRLPCIPLMTQFARGGCLNWLQNDQQNSRYVTFRRQPMTFQFTRNLSLLTFVIRQSLFCTVFRNQFSNIDECMNGINFFRGRAYISWVYHGRISTMTSVGR